MEAYSLEGYQITDLEKLLETCPWFPIARKELFLKMSAMGEEYRKEALATDCTVSVSGLQYFQGRIHPLVRSSVRRAGTG